MGLKNSKLPVNNSKLPVIPEDVIGEILSRLPARSLLRFRCLSKSWRSLIGSELFTKNHLQNIRTNKTDSHWRVLYHCPEHGLMQRSLQSYRDEPSAAPSAFDDRKNNHLMRGTQVVGHFNGVLCLLKYRGCFFLWNPTTRISRELPELDFYVARKFEFFTRKFGFGWDEGSDEYNLFAVLSYEEYNIGKVYSSKTDSWKTVDHGCLSLYAEYGNYGVFTNGKIHWLKEDGLQIETFDLNSEVFGTIDLPFKPVVGNSMWLQDYTGGCLQVVSENYDNKTHKIWSMKKYGVKESWVAKTLTFDEFTCCIPSYCYIESLASPIPKDEIDRRFFRFRY